MINYVRRGLTLAVAALFVALGCWLILDPKAVERLYPMSLNGPMALSEVRAIFGGLMAGVGAAILILDVVYKRQRDAVMVLATITGGLLLARVVGFVYEGVPSDTVLSETIFEVILFPVLVFLGAYRREN